LLETEIDDYLRSFQEKRLAKPAQCRICKQQGYLRWHGSYVRQLIALANTYSVPIRRLLCSRCRHTFALLPSFIAKFHRYAKEIIQRALDWLKTLTFDVVADRLSNDCLARENHSLAPLTLYLWRRKFGRPLHP